MVSINISLAQIQSFLLVFLRVGAILLSAPVLNGQSAPTLFKLGLILSISFWVFVTRPIDVSGFNASLVMFALMVASEVAVGLIIGFVVRTIFIGVQLGGQIAGYQMGLSIANVMDPASSMQVPIIAQIFNLFTILLFLSFNAHYWFIKALNDSFILVPPLEYQFSEDLVAPVLHLAGNIFVIAIKVAAPIMVSLLLSTVALGVLARTVPQMHIFIVAMPLKIVIGLFFLALTLPFLSVFLKDIFRGVGHELLGLIKLLA
ncbi:MAG: flagellar biosynthetic protein FliR [Desulfobacteraceae bacterium]|jgi:flagellar biosynthetic protein FliR